MCGLWPVFHTFGVFIIPESPSYLLSKDRKDDAKDAMVKLRGDNSTQIGIELTALQVQFHRIPYPIHILLDPQMVHIVKK